METMLRRREMIAAGGTGPRPRFYDYLIFDGTAYIDTDIIPDANASFRVYLGSEKNKAAQRIFGLATEPAVTTTVFYTSNTTSTQRNLSWYYASGSSLASRQLAFSTSGYSLFMTPKRGGYNTTASSFTKGGNTPAGALVIGHNGSHSGNPFSGKMSFFRIYGSDAQNATDASDLLNNYTPQYTLKPCVYNGEAGYWCVENGKFYGNSAGSGTLTVSNPL